MKEGEKTVFVRVDDYEKILSKVSMLTQHLNRAKEQLEVIKELKKDEDAEIADWEKELEIMEQKVNYITETMSKQG
ncbi:hypothetical protein DRJ48_02615 [Candidatus Woesearchaeota archaeon]|nr:hypothetical protein [Candidatus Woesearchaeota archaeon]RLE42844.1 MAG: hypothetical protein DRJ48_02615 [Candidatus Woesearchaeota archaeon]